MGDFFSVVLFTLFGVIGFLYLNGHPHLRWLKWGHCCCCCLCSKRILQSKDGYPLLSWFIFSQPFTTSDYRHLVRVMVKTSKVYVSREENEKGISVIKVAKDDPNSEKFEVTWAHKPPPVQMEPYSIAKIEHFKPSYVTLDVGEGEFKFVNPVVPFDTELSPPI